MKLQLSEQKFAFQLRCCCWVWARKVLNERQGETWNVSVALDVGGRNVIYLDAI